MKIGYIRVSKHEQNEALQRDALKEAGCEKYFSDVMTGSKFERKGLEQLLAFMRSGDTVIVWKLDRLGRSLKDLIETLNLLKDRGVDFISLFADPNHSIPEICSTLGISRSTLYRYVREAKKASDRP